MKKRTRILILCTALLLCLCMTACDLKLGGMLGQLLEHATGDIEDLPADMLGTIPGIGGDEIFDIETTMDAVTEIAPDYWASPELGAFDAFAGEEFVILSNRQEDLSPEESSADPVQEALYKRDDKIQYTYNVRLNGIVSMDYVTLSDMLKNDVQAGAGEYDLVYQHMVSCATELAMKGYLHNLANVDYLDLDQVWWDQGCNSGFMLGDQLMMVSGDLLPTSTALSAAVFFNQNLFDEYVLEYPYQDVREGTWTLDDMLKLTKDQTRDLNGDGRLYYEDDMYGLTGWALDCDYAYQFGAGGTMFTYEGDLPIYSVNSDKLEAIYSRIYDLIVSNCSLHVTVAQYQQNNHMHEEPRNVFVSGRALFFTGLLTDARLMIGSGMEQSFGILPMPKYDEDQEAYQSFVNGSASVAVLPQSLRDEQLTSSGFMMELLASSSYYMVNDSLHRSFVQNDSQFESLQMLDVITSCKIVDFGYVYFHTDGLPCANIVQTSLNKNLTSISSEIVKREKVTERAIAKVYAAYGYDYNN